MLKIGICDDDDQMLKEFMELLDCYRIQTGQALDYDTYQSSIELINAIQKGAEYHVLLMDILMPGEDGIETAREIREYDHTVKIIYFTSSPEFAMRSYETGAYGYQLKPIKRENFFNLMTEVFTAVKEENLNNLTVKSRMGLIKIPVSLLEYCEVMGNAVFFHMSTGQVVESTGNMKEIDIRLMSHVGFLRVHRSYTVNLDYITNITSRVITMQCQSEIPIPHGKYTAVKEAFLKNAFRKGWKLYDGDDISS